VYDFKRRQLAPCSSYFHLFQIVDEAGTVLGYVTRTNSAQEGERKYRAAAGARQRAGKRVTDVSAGSGGSVGNLAGNSRPIETRVAWLEESRAAQVWHLSERSDD
jgi:hypothetical protein